LKGLNIVYKLSFVLITKSCGTILVYPEQEVMLAFVSCER
jgi:hypothetical protein